MVKYSKGITVARGISILVTDKDSFAECDKVIKEELSRRFEISEETKKEIIEKVLS